MAEYKLSGDGVFKRDTGLYIPENESNRDWRAYLRYVADGGVTDPQYTQDELDAIAALEARVAELEAERESANIRDITPQQAKNYIDAQFAAATTNAEVVTAIKRILKKMVVFLLR